MALISKPYTFSAGATIIASEHNSNFDTIYSEFNGSISNTNISSGAAIAYSKLNLTGAIVNADVSAGAAIAGSKLNLVSPGAIGTTTPAAGKFTTLEATTTLKSGTTNQGDILYDNGTSLVRLTPGTSGQFLKTLGAAANPAWATVPSLSNVIFSYATQVDNPGFVTNTTLTNAATSNYQYYAVSGVGSLSYKTIISSKLVKIAGISTVTVWAYIWCSGAAGTQANCKVNIGATNGNVSGTSLQTTPEWKNFTIDISGLSNGTTYDITIQLANADSSNSSIYLGSVIGFGS